MKNGPISYGFCLKYYIDFQISSSMSRGFGFKFKKTQFEIICHSWTACRCAANTFQGRNGIRILGCHRVYLTFGLVFFYQSEAFS